MSVNVADADEFGPGVGHTGTSYLYGDEQSVSNESDYRPAKVALV
jgi:hypothetical protein